MPRSTRFSCHQAPIAWCWFRWATMAIWSICRAPAASRSRNHSAQVLPVLACTAAALTTGALLAAGGENKSCKFAGLFGSADSTTSRGAT